MKDELIPKVSVCVIVYNHSSYILECLKSIAEQRCSFPFEVVIRDDASPDGSGDIIADFIAKNQLSNFTLYRAEKNEGMMLNFSNALQLCKGDFIAFCEGDDYWTDDLKLEKQTSLMENNPGCALSVHPCYHHKSTSNKKSVGYNKGSLVYRFYPDNVLETLGQFGPTASYMIRKDVKDGLPPWFSHAPIGDFFIEVYSLKFGFGLYMPDVMSAYRVISLGSWSNEMSKDPTGENGVRGYRLIKIYIKKALIDFPEYKEAFIKRVEFINFSIANQYMNGGNYTKFLKYTNKAGKSFCSLGLIAKILYHFRNVKPIVFLIYKLKRSFLYAKTLF